MTIVKVTREELNNIQQMFEKYPEWDSVLIEIPDESPEYTQESPTEQFPYVRSLSESEQVAGI